jgi:hypothetical protein
MFIESEDTQTSVSAAGLDVSVVRPVPLIERFENVGPTHRTLKLFEALRYKQLSYFYMGSTLLLGLYLTYAGLTA